MDATGTLESIARLLPSLPDESVESLLITFDALVGVSDDSLRPAEAQFLRDAAAASSQPARRDRLLRAADAVAAGQPCALTPDGLTAKQAAAAQTMTQAEWEEHIARSPLPPPPSPSEPEEDDEDSPDTEDLTYLEEFERLNTRKASVVHVGGFRPSGDPLASNFGLRPLGAEGEEWPTMNGMPLLFVCQLNLTAAPAVPALLEGVALITFFVDPAFGDLAKENGAGWRLLAYASLDGLVEMKAPAGTAKLNRGFECRWEALDDHPNYDDPDRVVPDGFDDSDAELEGAELENVARTKIGGYASSIQSEPWWGYGEHASAPAYCLQINSEEKVGLVWGDAGTVYLARGTAEGCGDQWFLDWQCY